MLSFLVSCNKNDDGFYASKIEASSVVCDSCVKQSLKASVSSDYGIYGRVGLPVTGTISSIVESPTVYIYKMIGGVWTYQGSTNASICGYYTYNTNGYGYYKAQISGYYYLRSPDCTTQVDGYYLHNGSGDGYVTILSPWTVVNVRCS
jgi:hypothetical protein